MKVKNIMTAEVVTLKVDEELSLASDIMTLGRIRHLPVVEGDHLVGIISQRDLFKASLASVMSHDFRETRDHLKEITIKEVMVRNVETIDPEAEIHDAGLMMLKKKTGCLPVVQNENLVGMLTETDILKFYVLQHQNDVKTD